MSINHAHPMPQPPVPSSAPPAGGIERAPADAAPPRKEGGRFVGWGVFLVLVAAGAFAAYHWRADLAIILRRFSGSASNAPTSRPARPPVPVIAAIARQGNLPIYLDGLGNVVALNTVTVRSRVEGQLLKVHFEDGQAVKQGDQLAEIDPRPFILQRDQARAQKTQAQAQRKRDEAARTLAMQDLARYEEAGDVIPRQQVDAANSAKAQAEAAIASDDAMIANIEVQIQSAELQISYCNITSPITGRAGLRLMDAGNMVHANDPQGLVVITQLQPISVVFYLSQENLPQVQRAFNNATQKPLPVEAYNNRDFNSRLAVGKLSAIDNQIDPTTAKIRLKATFDNESNSLFANQLINVRLLVDTRVGAVLVPSAAIQRNADLQPFVYVIRNDAAQIQLVKPGLVEGDTTLIESGLSAGEVIITDGVDKLMPGDKVFPRIAGAGASTRPGEGRGDGRSGRRGG